MDAQQAWQTALEQLEQEIPRSRFNQWAGDISVLSYQDGQYTIGVPTVSACDWLEGRLTSVIRRSLMGILNRSDIVVRFVVQEAKAVEESELPEEVTGEDPETGEEKHNLRPAGGSIKLHGWTPVPDELVQKYGLSVAAVAGKIWRYSRMRDHVCRVTVSRLAAELNLSQRTILRAIQILVSNDYVLDRTPTLRHRPHCYVSTEKCSLFGSRKEFPLGTFGQTASRPGDLSV